MKTTISIHSFRDAFQSLRPDDFTYDGLNALFDYLEEYEEGTDTELDLDGHRCHECGEGISPVICARNRGRCNSCQDKHLIINPS